MKQWIVPLLFLAALGGYGAFHLFPGATAKAPHTVTCTDPVGEGCRFALAGQAVAVRFLSPPQALAPFVLRVSAPGASAIQANFAMASMDMGLNQYRLLPAGTGIWEAKVILPVCVTGRSDWVLTLTLDGAAVQIPFIAGK